MLVEDPAAFMGEWGEPVLLDGEDVGLGIFSDPYADNGLGSAGLSTSGPRVLLPTANVPERDPADTTDPVLELPDRYDGTQVFRYIVTEIQPDGTLMSTLILQQSPDQS